MEEELSLFFKVERTSVLKEKIYTVMIMVPKVKPLFHMSALAFRFLVCPIFWKSALFHTFLLSLLLQKEGGKGGN